METVNVFRPLAIFAEMLHHRCLTGLLMRLCPINYLQLTEGLRKSFPPQVILDSPCLLILLSHTKQKNNKMISWADPEFLYP